MAAESPKKQTQYKPNQTQSPKSQNEYKLIYQKGLQKKRWFRSPKKQTQFKPNLYSVFFSKLVPAKAGSVPRPHPGTGQRHRAVRLYHFPGQTTTGQSLPAHT